MIKVVSFYTADYADCARRLVESLDELGLSHNVVEIEGFGSWLKNVNYKPVFIREQLRWWHDSLVYIDSDAVVHSYPFLFDVIGTDIGCHFRNDARYVNECLSGTLFFSKTVGAVRILDDWIRRTRRTPNAWDQRTLQETLESLYSISIYRLPASYTQIFDTMSDRGEPVIEHFQASRGKDKT